MRLLVIHLTVREWKEERLSRITFIASTVAACWRESGR